MKTLALCLAAALQTASTMAFPSATRCSGSRGRNLVAAKVVGGQLVRAFGSTTALGATQYLVRYEYVPDVLEKRAPYREEHLNLANKLQCLSGGPTGEPGMEVPKGALLVFADLENAEAFVKEDPYTQNGIVTSHSIDEWNVVVQRKE